MRTDEQRDRLTDRQTDGWTDRQTDRQTNNTKLIVAFSNFMNAPKKTENVHIDVCVNARVKKYHEKLSEKEIKYKS